MKSLIEGLAMSMLDTAKANLVRDKYLTPVAFVVGPNGEFGPIGLDFSTYHEKVIAFRALVKTAISVNAVGLIIITDAWAKKIDADKLVEFNKNYVNGSLEHDKERVEVLQMVIAPFGKKFTGVTTPYERVGPDDTIVFKPSEHDSSVIETGLLEGWPDFTPSSTVQ